MRARRVAATLAAVVAIALAWHLFAPWTPVPGPRGSDHRVIVLGFDGLDPVLLDEGIKAGRLPHFAALANGAPVPRLATTEPPQSPVAWSSFATGSQPGDHGVFDFLHRNPETYTPEFSIATQAPTETLNVFGWQMPIREGALLTRRQGTPFWVQAEHEGLRVSVYRVPVTYPVDDITHMLAGMGVPDLLGSQGTYTLIANHLVADAESGGRVMMSKTEPDGSVRVQLRGPANPLDGSDMTLPLAVFPAADGVDVDLGGVRTHLQAGAWSDWIPLDFRFLGVGTVRGMVRLNLVTAFPRMRLYVSPIQADPTDSVLPISAPPGDAAQLAARIGRFHTLGMPEETWAMNQSHLDENAWLDNVRTTLAEGEAMLAAALASDDSDIIVKTFVQTDRVSHMFWRGRDVDHPLHAETTPQARAAIDWIYGEADRIVGETRQRMRPDDRLIILSDHGFTNYRRSANLNRWLVDHGFLVLQPGASSSAPLFASVDWSKSRAYALGLNGVFINRAGREAQGIVVDADVDALLTELAQQLGSWQDDANDMAPVIARVARADAIYRGAASASAPDLMIGYARGYRASWQTSLGGVPMPLLEDNRQLWSGDHCVAADLVPGVLLTSFPLAQPVTGIADVGALVRAQATPGAPAP